MGRKNWLFANTPGGAQASAAIYSLIETAKENGLNPYQYLLWLLQNAPGLSETDEAWAEKLLPARAPEECYMPQKEMAAFYTWLDFTLTVFCFCQQVRYCTLPLRLLNSLPVLH